MDKSDEEMCKKVRQKAVEFDSIILPGSRASFGEIAPVEVGVLAHFIWTEMERYRINFEVVNQADGSPYLRVAQVVSAQAQSDSFLPQSIIRAADLCAQATDCRVDVPLSPANDHADAAFVQTVECPFELPPAFQDEFTPTLHGVVEQY